MNNITPITTTLGEFLAIKLPVDANTIDIEGDRLYYWATFEGVQYLDFITLPPGQWQIMDFRDSLTEEQWRGIVDSILDFDY